MDAIITQQDIVNRCISLGANIGSLPSTWKADPTILSVMNPSFTQERLDKFLSMDYSHIHRRMYFADTDQFFGTEAGDYQYLLSQNAPGLKTTLRYTKDALVSKLGCGEATIKPVESMAGDALTIQTEKHTCTGSKSFKTYVYGNVDNYPGTSVGSFAGYAVRDSHLPLYPPPRADSIFGDYLVGNHVVAFLPQMINDYNDFRTK